MNFVNTAHGIYPAAIKTARRGGRAARGGDFYAFLPESKPTSLSAAVTVAAGEAKVEKRK